MHLAVVGERRIALQAACKLVRSALSAREGACYAVNLSMWDRARNTPHIHIHIHTRAGERHMAPLKKGTVCLQQARYKP